MEDAASLLPTSSGIETAYLGPALSRGPLPAIFYFALSARESLCQDPFNQPAVYLSSLPLRIFSMTLPGHGTHLPAVEALSLWAREMQEGRDVVTAFVEQVHVVVESLIHEGILLPNKIAAMGLSRGAFIATHAAAKVFHFRWILGFAPLTKLSKAKEFQSLLENPLLNALDLENLADKIADRHLRYYIGNLDTRVSTRKCFDFIERLSQTAQGKKIRAPQVELFIGPSIGHMGHGTSKEIFHQGAQWLAEQLGAIDAL